MASFLPPGRALHALALTAALAAGVATPARGQDRPDDPAPVRQEFSEGAVRVSLEADRTTIPIDGQIRLTLLVEAPRGTDVTLPEVGSRLGPFVVASQGAPEPTTEAAATALWRRDYLLEAEDVGALRVPSLSVSFRGKTELEGAARRLQTEPLAVTVTSVLPPDVDIAAPKDIAPPVPLQRVAGSWLPWLLGLAALGLTVLTALAWRRRKRRPVASGLRPAHLLALAELERLQGQLPAGQLVGEEVYLRLADILRRYVVRRFGLRADAQTTEELLASAARSGGPIAARRHLIGPVLASCDLVKFARHRPRPDDLPIQLRQTRAFIEQTADEQVRGRSAGQGS